jgi:hypothetical protein
MRAVFEVAGDVGRASAKKDKGEFSERTGSAPTKTDSRDTAAAFCSLMH